MGGYFQCCLTKLPKHGHDHGFSPGLLTKTAPHRLVLFVVPFPGAKATWRAFLFFIDDSAS
jgi:hypothetical protein